MWYFLEENPCFHSVSLFSFCFYYFNSRLLFDSYETRRFAKRIINRNLWKRAHGEYPLCRMTCNPIHLSHYNYGLCFQEVLNCPPLALLRLAWPWLQCQHERRPRCEQKQKLEEANLNSKAIRQHKQDGLVCCLPQYMMQLSVSDETTPQEPLNYRHTLL